MFVTTMATETENGDTGLYLFYSEIKPTEEQLYWWLFENGRVYDNVCLEQIDDYITDHLISGIPSITEFTVWATENPKPEVERL